MPSSANPDELICSFCTYEVPKFRELPDGFANGHSESIPHDQRISLFLVHLQLHEIAYLKAISLKH